MCDKVRQRRGKLVQNIVTYFMDGPLHTGVDLSKILGGHETNILGGKRW